MKLLRADPEVVAMLAQWLADAEAGLITDIAIVGRYWNGEWGEETATTDLADLVCEVRSSVIRMQTAAAAAEPSEH